MSPSTANLLRGIRHLADVARADPTSSRLRGLREAVHVAEAAWVADGCPDAPEPKAVVIVTTCGRAR